jgi:hypothetical protein
MASRVDSGQASGMEVIRAGGRSRPSVRALAVARLIGVLYVVTGLCVAWLTLATPFVELFSARGRAFASEPAFHALGWLMALALPATCLLLGSHRLLEFTEIPNPFRARRDPLAGLGSSLGRDYVAVRGFILPGGRSISALLVGPPGIVVLGLLPPPSEARPVGGHWEARTSDDQWVAAENPLDRAARDAEAVRRWLIGDDHDFAVKVYAVVLANDTTVGRTKTTTVIDRTGLPGFLASLPPHRTFTSSRRDRVVARIRGGIDPNASPSSW